ncbi:MAG: DUF3368 domain-containing protein [Candidatus Aenigmarchaeota archaeon]|nr:DUF3368 domain-containing protein [Candidatus Aenigmarchaeota archaeon]
MKIVCDASPLIFLARINKLYFLDTYQILIPDQVYAEIKIGKEKGKNEFIIIDHYISQRKIHMEKTEILIRLPTTIAEGEAAVISLALQHKIQTVLIDERKARTIAKLHDLQPKGVLAVLVEQKKQGKITDKEFKELLTKLIHFGFRISEELLSRVYQM